MANKEEKGESKQSFFKNFVKVEMIPNILSSLKGVVDGALTSAKEYAEKTVDFALKKVYAFTLIVLGMIFLLVGIAMLFENAEVLPRGSGFVIIGFLIAFAGFIINAVAKR